MFSRFDASDRRDFTSGLRFEMALHFLLRTDQEQLDHAEDQNHWQHRATQAADALKKH